MIRKTIIVVLTLGAVGTAFVFLLSGPYYFGYGWEGNGLYFMQGVMTLHRGAPDTWIDPSALGWAWGTYGEYRESLRMSQLPIYMRIPYSEPDSSGQAWYPSLRVPLWIPFLLFVVYPTGAFIRGPVRRWCRRGRGECVACGYNLTGNVSGVCSECGAEVGAPRTRGGGTEP